MSLKNYNGLTDLRKHVQNMSGSLELVINDNDSMCKILLITFWGFAHAWYNNLEPNYIKRFSDLCTKLMARFNTNIPVYGLFDVTQQEDKSTRAFLKRFNKEMLKVDELCKPMALEALIRGVR